MQKIFAILLGTLAVVLLTTPASFAAGMTLTPPKFEFDADPGQTIRDVIKISNQGSDTLFLGSAVQDFVSSGETGQPSFVDASENDPSISLSHWVTVNDNQPVQVAPGQRVEVPFVIRVPTDAEPGGHYGAVFLAPPAGEGQIGVTQRIGSLVLVRVRGEINESGRLDTFGVYPREISGENIPESSSRFFFESLPVPFAVRYENTGNIHTKPQGQIEIRNVLGMQLSEVGVLTLSNEQGVETGKEIVDFIPVNDRQGNVLAHSFRTFRAEWQGSPYWYRHDDGSREIRYRGYPIGLYTATLTLAGASGAEVVDSVRFIIFPWKEVFGGTLLLILLGFGTLRLYRWRAAAAEAAFKKKYGIQK